jgi:hypothetical protein
MPSGRGRRDLSHCIPIAINYHLLAESNGRDQFVKSIHGFCFAHVHKRIIVSTPPTRPCGSFNSSER